MLPDLAGQLDAIELASWADAWLHEARGQHGEWIRAGTGLDRYSVPPHSRLIAKGGYKDPASHPFFKAHPVSPANIIRAYDESTPQEKTQGEHWYPDAHNLASKMTGGDAREGAILLASYSPQSSWPANMFNAARAADQRRALGPKDGMITGAMQANAQEALDGKSIDEALTSPKTRAFARLIELGGDAPDDGAGEVVIDRHALNVAAGETLPKEVTDKAPIGDPRYHEYVADQYRQAALQLSKREGRVIPPNVLQAQTWLHQQAAAQALDALAGADRGGKALKKGRVTGIANAWKKWAGYAAAGGIPLTPNTALTAASEMLLDQILEMAGDGLAIQLAGWGDAWKHELRGPDGRWTRGMDTLEIHTRGGQLTPERQELHDRIVASALAGHQPQAHPVAEFLGGGTASGKSTVLGHGGSPDSVQIDADAVKTQLPEFGAMVAAGDHRAATHTHEESSAIAKRIQAGAIGQRMNFTLDGTGDSDYAKARGKIEAARKAGYSTSGRYVTVDTDEAIRRAGKRAGRTGRMVPESVIRQIHSSVTNVFRQLVENNELDKAELWDNNGTKPALIGSKQEGGSWTVHDQAAWQKFLAKEEAQT